ncbi:MAG: hypothetical protein NC328_05365 [Muribaculum sp.]|nr:hypothetical protein [Muribaculum sp.]
MGHNHEALQYESKDSAYNPEVRKLPAYSVAIRTLGLAPKDLKAELESLHNQSILPDKIVIYIAKGYARPEFTVGKEEYVEVPKGMMRQRLLDYKEIDSECILMIDDDMQLSRHAARTLLEEMVRHGADCMAYDIIGNRKWSVAMKLRSAIMRWERPHFRREVAFRIHGSGAFSYMLNPRNASYPSQSAAGGVAMWRKSAFIGINAKDELWLDDLGFAYGEDELLFYKLYVNGGKLRVNYTADIKNLDSRTGRSSTYADRRKFMIRSMSNAVRWHRQIYSISKNKMDKLVRGSAFALRTLWMSAIQLALAAVTLQPAVFTMHLKGLREAYRFVNSETYRSLPPYIIPRL